MAGGRSPMLVLAAVHCWTTGGASQVDIAARQNDQIEPVDDRSKREVRMKTDTESCPPLTEVDRPQHRALRHR
jgi:hypothetical protein